MNSFQHLSIDDYDYLLPEEKIALFPSNTRDESKLLVYKDKTISEDIFKHIPNYLDEDVFLIFNNTRVIQARILFSKPTGATIELFCLEPLAPTTVHSLIFETVQCCEWECFVGNNKRFTSPLQLHFTCKGEAGVLRAEKTGSCNKHSFRIRFDWTPAHLSFAEVLESVGKIPLPPYIKRETVESDAARYQTLFAQEKGSVAAPTAGLHFTPKVFQEIKEKNIPTEYITLHVGAGTFKPVSEPQIQHHIMHREQLFFTKHCLEQLLRYKHKKIVATGTTTARALESLYWMGVKLTNATHTTEHCFHIGQWDAYQTPSAQQTSPEQSLQSVLTYLDKNGLGTLHASTSLMITPYYKPQMVKGIITNFHQPKSTLLLLIAAFVGKEWEKIYHYALSHDFRFLSYGDACLFM